MQKIAIENHHCQWIHKIELYASIAEVLAITWKAETRPAYAIGVTERDMNHWQPMIDRCNAMDRRINEILTRQMDLAKSPAKAAFETLPLYTIDELETVLFAVRYAANSLGAMKMGASQQGTLPNPAMKKTAE